MAVADDALPPGDRHHAGRLRPDLLHRDLANVAAWFNRRDVAVDLEAVYGELIGLAW